MAGNDGQVSGSGTWIRLRSEWLTTRLLARSRNCWRFPGAEPPSAAWNERSVQRLVHDVSRWAARVGLVDGTGGLDRHVTRQGHGHERWLQPTIGSRFVGCRRCIAVCGRLKALIHEGWEVTSRPDAYKVAGTDATTRLYACANVNSAVSTVHAGPETGTSVWIDGGQSLLIG